MNIITASNPKVELKIVGGSIIINIYTKLDYQTEIKRTFYASSVTKQFMIDNSNYLLGTNNGINPEVLFINFLVNENIAKINYIKKIDQYVAYVLTLTPSAMLELL